MAQQDHTATQTREPGVGAAARPAQAPPRTKPSKPKRRKLPPFKLILHNDDFNAMDEVVRAIVRIAQLSVAGAVQRMLEAHLSGKSLLLVTHKERGELYVQQFTSCKITTSLEPDA